MNKKKYFGLVLAPPHSFYKFGETIEEVISTLEKTPIDNKRSIMVGVINTESLTLEHVGQNYVGREDRAVSTILKLYGTVN